jgi:hypothetical protein
VARPRGRHPATGALARPLASDPQIVRVIQVQPIHPISRIEESSDAEESDEPLEPSVEPDDP